MDFFRILLCRILHSSWFSGDFRLIFRTFFYRIFHFHDVQMILDGFLVQCFAECSIFPRVSNYFRWIFRTLFCIIFNLCMIFTWFISPTLFCRMIHFPGFWNAFRCIFRTLLCRMIYLVQDCQMILDGLFAHSVAELSIFQEFHMILDGVFVQCFAECSIF